MTQTTVQTRDGRLLAVEVDGEPDGAPVLVQMGTPNSRHLFAPNVEDARSRGLRLICYDRPGYGGSSPNPGRKVADCAADVRAICEALNLERIGMWGISGGGPHALACAALLPDLVSAAASLAAVAPYGVDGLDYFAGMGEDNVEDTRLLLSDTIAAREKVQRDRDGYVQVTAAALSEALATLLSETDRAALDEELARYLAWTAREGLAPGAEGWWEDDLAFIEDWGFRLADIVVPVLLMHGREDRFVPFDHGRWLAREIPGVEARLLAEDGHLTLLVDRVGEVHAWLAQHL